MADSQNILICPACGNEMTKIFISEKGINIDICDKNCGGIYFDNQEIQEINDSQTGFDEIKEILTDKNFMPVDDTQTRICPNCQTPMAKTNALGIKIDTCYKCGGIFLDNGEFDKVRSKFVKKQKIQPINLNNSGINLQEFYKDTQDEIFLKTSNNHRLNSNSLLRLILELIF